MYCNFTPIRENKNKEGTGWEMVGDPVAETTSGILCPFTECSEGDSVSHQCSTFQHPSQSCLFSPGSFPGLSFKDPLSLAPTWHAVLGVISTPTGSFLLLLAS